MQCFYADFCVCCVVVVINSSAALQSPPVLTAVCIQLTGQIEWTDCNQTMWPYGVSAIPARHISDKYVEAELELIALFGCSELTKVSFGRKQSKWHRSECY